MTYERSIQAAVPKVAHGRVWLATALLEAPDVNGTPGEWVAIEAVPGGTRIEQINGLDVAVPTGVVADTVSSRHAQHSPGWYRLQWYDDGQNSRFSAPVRVEDGEPVSSGRWN